jgi:2-keto-4-pentenoate hydratase/2-oxohepta-3-ene-1,7-dioic acid hydratase in catechol pathway
MSTVPMSTRPMSTVQIEGAEPLAITNVLCLGRTYAKHAAELGNAVPPSPLVFLKSTRCVRGLVSGGPLAFADEVFHHEAEVVLAIGRDVPLGARAGWEDIAAVGLGLDLTRREEQSALKAEGHPWTTAKSFAGAAVLTPFTPCDRIAERDAIAFELHVEGVLRQRGTTADLTRDVPALLGLLAAFVPLGRGDLVFTGTPEGVGPIRVGERFVLSSPQLGRHSGTL